MSAGEAKQDEVLSMIRRVAATAACGAVVLVAACEPRVTVEVPKDPIVVNLNVKIEHEVRVKVDRELDELFENNPELFK